MLRGLDHIVHAVRDLPRGAYVFRRDLTALELLKEGAFRARAVYLGLGQAPPASDWGLMINENRQALTIQPWGAVMPVIAIALLTIGTSLIGDGVSRAALGIDQARGRIGKLADGIAMRRQALRLDEDRPAGAQARRGREARRAAVVGTELGRPAALHEGVGSAGRRRRQADPDHGRLCAAPPARHGLRHPPGYCAYRESCRTSQRWKKHWFHP